MKTTHHRSPRLLLVASFVLLAACGDDDPGAPPCAELAGECIGVPPAALCDSDPCIGSAPCASVLSVSTDAELQAALGQATAGACIALGPGTYGTAAAPGGVSLLGRGAADVRVQGVSLGDGAGAWIRGMEIQGGGLELGSATEVHVEAVRISGAATGLSAGPGSIVTIARSEIIGSGQYGILGAEPASVTVAHTVIRDSTGPGLWVQCAAGCDCVQKPSVTVDHVQLQNNRVVSAALLGVMGSLHTVEIADSEDEGWTGMGAGLSVSACSSVEVSGLSVARSETVGVLVDSSAAVLGTGAENKGIIIVDSRPGVWIQGVGAPAQDPGQSVRLEGADITNCAGAGIGIDHAARGIIIVDSKVANTANTEMLVDPILDGRSATIGHGLVWKDGSAASIDGLSVSASAGYGFLIDGAVGDGSSIASLSLGGGDEQIGVVQQQVEAQDMAPAMGSATPELQRDVDKLADVPTGVEPPATTN